MLADAMAVQIDAHDEFQWAGWLENSPQLVEAIQSLRPDVVLMDIDMPGPDPFRTVELLSAASPGIRVLMFSAYVRQDYVDRAISRGAWGYISKNESMSDVLDALRRAHHGEFVLTPEVLAEHRAAP
jgi:DNA-binding NarL/FixJ family response regulator